MARAMAGARSGGLGMGAVRRTASAHSAAAAHAQSAGARRLSAGEWSLLDRISEDPSTRGRAREPRSRRESLEGENSYVLAQLGAGGSPLNSAPTSAHATMSASSARDLAAELKLQDVMLSSQTLSGAAGRALADELRHALDFRQPGLPPESRARRLSVGDRPARARRLSAGAGGGENAAAVTSLTGAHARELARELAERLAKAEAMVPAEREAAKKKSPPH